MDFSTLKRQSLSGAEKRKLHEKKMKEVAKGQMSLLGFIDKPSISTSTSSTLPELNCGGNDTDMQEATNANAMLMNEGNFNALSCLFICHRRVYSYSY